MGSPAAQNAAGRERKLYQLNVLVSPFQSAARQLTSFTRHPRRTVSVPPLGPKEVEWVQALQAVQVLKRTVRVLLVPLRVHKRVPRTLQGLTAPDIRLNDGRLNPVEAKVLKCVPSARLVGSTRDSLAPKFRAENHRTTRRLTNQLRVTTLIDIDQGRVTDKGARDLLTFAFEYPDTPDEGVSSGSSLLKPLLLVFGNGRKAHSHVTRHAVPLEATAMRQVHKLGHNFLREGRKFDA